MTSYVKRYERSSLELGNFHAIIWECHHSRDSDRPGELEYLFSIQRLNTKDVMEAFSYGLDELETVLKLIHWADAEIESFYEEF